MKNSKFFYLYLIAAFIALILLIYNVVSTYPQVQLTSIIIEIILVIFFFYMANKTYHEKKDREMM